MKAFGIAVTCFLALAGALPQENDQHNFFISHLNSESTSPVILAQRNQFPSFSNDISNLIGAGDTIQENLITNNFGIEGEIISPSVDPQPLFGQQQTFLPLQPNSQITQGVITAFPSQSSFQDQSQTFVSSSQDNLQEIVNGKFEPLNLPSGASKTLGSIDESFSCLNRAYGYYADEANGCRVYHVCYPALFDDGHSERFHYSFLCNDGQVFDQSKLTCLPEFEAISCSESQSFYFMNESFGKEE